ncbi:MAG: reverse transcriptase domain-containing protein [Streptococcus thermophilus]
MQDEKKNTLVPTTLPYLQLKTDTMVYKRNQEVFDSVYDFCTQFQTVLEAHSLSMDDNWERLLPMSLNKEERSWFDEKLRNKLLAWSQARSMILDHYDTPYRKFLLMVKVWSMKQSTGESTRSYAAKFQNLRRQAGLADGLQLVLCFWCSLRESVRRVASVAVSSQYGTKLPVKIEDMIGLVIASTNDTDLFSSTSDHSNYSGNKGNNERSYKRSSQASSAYKDSNESNKISKTSLKSSPSKKPCTYCGDNWFHGHRCDAFREAMARKKQKVSRMAIRSGESDSVDEDSSMGEDDENAGMARLALECKSKDKDKITRDFKNVTTNITFPILVNNSCRTTSLLDCGAVFSSVDLKFCKENNINIKYINHINKDLISKENRFKYFIRLAHNDTYVKRIGTCTLSVSCNNKTIKREFEVMNLTNDGEFSISIGTDYMSSLGMGIVGLPTSYDDRDSQEEVIEANRRYNNTSDLLESIEAENKTLENCPACNLEEYNSAMEFIQTFIAHNQAIPKGSFCTIPESVVSLDTPTDVTAYKKPYPIPLKMHSVVDNQIKEWLDDGIIKRAPANTEWNTPLTVVKKTDGKGELTGHRVCHDPRHINSLLKTVDRMPLPIISELFEDLKGAFVYSTLDLKSAFNSLRLNPKDAHKLSFTWRNVQYQPIGTVFGIRHVSSQFQRTMSIVLADLPFVRYFVDDIVCASQSIEEHKEHLKQIIQRLTEVNLKLNPDKCRFFQSEIYLLGFRISPNGISMDRRKLINVLDFPQPKCGNDIMRYCELINYFRTLIPNVSAIMSPL